MNTETSAMKVYAVIGGYDYEGEDFKSLRLFDCKSAAEEYFSLMEDSYDYAIMDTREVIMESTIVTQ